MYIYMYIYVFILLCFVCIYVYTCLILSYLIVSYLSLHYIYYGIRLDYNFITYHTTYAKGKSFLLRAQTAWWSAEAGYARPAALSAGQ